MELGKNNSFNFNISRKQYDQGGTGQQEQDKKLDHAWQSDASLGKKTGEENSEELQNVRKNLY